MTERAERGGIVSYIEYIERELLLHDICDNCDGDCDIVGCDCINCRKECRCEAVKTIIEQPASDVQEVVRCKECKYFELDHIDIVNEMPIITAHEICTRWGRGCKTIEDGFCFLGERKTTK